jgi:glycerophosphoryl diester phosphodiesterase
MTLDEVKRYDVGRLKPGTAYAANFPEQRGMDGVRIPALTEVLELVRTSGAEHVRFNIETKLTAASGTDTPDPETFAAAFAAAVRAAGLTARVTLQSFDWRTIQAMRRIAPEIERVCLTIDGGNGDTLRAASRAVAVDSGPRHRRFRQVDPRRWWQPPAARCGRRCSAISSRTISPK